MCRGPVRTYGLQRPIINSTTERGTLLRTSGLAALTADLDSEDMAIGSDQVVVVMAQRVLLRNQMPPDFEVTLFPPL